jgi:sec-independent protein translocase protein TatA
VFGDILQPTHLIFILLVALLVLGPKRLPEVGRSLGKGLRDFRSAMNGLEDHTQDIIGPMNEHLSTQPLPVAPAELAPMQVAEPAPVAEPVHATVTAEPSAAVVSPETPAAPQFDD